MSCTLWSGGVLVVAFFIKDVKNVLLWGMGTHFLCFYIIAYDFVK